MTAGAAADIPTRAALLAELKFRTYIRTGRLKPAPTYVTP